MKSIRGLIVTAAFIGPGTITTASVAGASLGYSIVWALQFAIFATSVLQLMAKRLGSSSGMGLSEAALTLSQHTWIRWIIITLIVLAIGLGNATYQGGNITGAALGLSTLSGLSIQVWALILGVLASSIIIFRKQALIEKILLVLVLIMSLVFVALMFIADTQWMSILEGLNPLATDFSQFGLILALIGTTIVPYNLYLHSAMEAKASHPENDKRDGDWPLIASIGLGGLITLAVISNAATAFFAAGLSMDSGNIAQQLAPLLGEYASIFFALGFFAAGISSAITAPLATAFALSGLFNWQNDLQDTRFLGVCLAVIAIGTLLASLGIKAFVLIVSAQITNAFLLPISVVLLLLACNNPKIMKGNTVSRRLNILCGLALLLVIGLSSYKLL